MSIALRDYQTRCIEELFAWFANGGVGNPLLVAPTGAGKSVLLAAIIQHILSNWPGQRICMLTHVRELIEQNHDKLVSLWPEAPAGIYSAGLKRKDADAQIVYAGIQSIAKKALHVGWFDIIFVDECHLIPKRGDGRYRKFLEDVRTINPNVRVVGLTATPFRLDSGYLHKGEGALFSDIATEVTITELLEKGYLSPVISRPTHIDLDTSGIKKRGGEFVTSSIGAALKEQGHIDAALTNAIEKAADREGWLVFCPTVSTAEDAASFLNARGIKSAVISSETEPTERDRLIAEYKRGDIKALANCEVLTTGFDAPRTDCVILLRPTESTVLYIQMIGRGMRIAPGKENCLILDYAGNIERHGCIDDPNIRIPKDKKEPGEAPVKVCPDCDAFCHASAATCIECGHEFPPPKSKVEQEHSTAALLKAQRAADIHEVHLWELKAHNKPGKPTSLRVDYKGAPMLGIERLRASIVSEWVCFEHQGFAQTKAAQWWFQHGGEIPAPKTTEEAIERAEELTTPVQIGLTKDGKYSRITRREFPQGSEAAA